MEKKRKTSSNFCPISEWASTFLTICVFFFCFLLTPNFYYYFFLSTPRAVLTLPFQVPGVSEKEREIEKWGSGLRKCVRTRETALTGKSWRPFSRNKRGRKTLAKKLAFQNANHKSSKLRGKKKKRNNQTIAEATERKHWTHHQSSLSLCLSTDARISERYHKTNSLSPQCRPTLLWQAFHRHPPSIFTTAFGSKKKKKKFSRNKVIPDSKKIVSQWSHGRQASSTALELNIKKNPPTISRRIPTSTTIGVTNCAVMKWFNADW